MIKDKRGYRPLENIDAELRLSTKTIFFRSSCCELSYHARRRTALTITAENFFLAHEGTFCTPLCRKASLMFADLRELRVMGCIYFLSYKYIITELTKKHVDRIIHNMDFRLGNLRGWVEVTTEMSGAVHPQS